ncbi:uncharacterized protein N7511_005650 [Penicillium nucicola]|uniref:uncharacterized protein n=1 Tax=Penicillium nucicola TaxID=1850975 RepID=UPI002545B8DE|nr:uncharacterized protein N7511_005650 [Penicillium nucicola]KAJ5762268.1 hypothetical protein N7511_005650 [Penicillium nucicola]
MASAKRESLSACTSVESMGSAMASMPHYLSTGVNKLTASTVNDAVDALKSMLLLTITALGEIIYFVLNMMYSTYACLIAVAVNGTIKAGIEVVESATSWINGTLVDIGDDIEGVVDKYQTGLDAFISKFNSVATFFDKDFEKIDLNSTIDKLENLSLPSSVNDTISKMDKLVLPDFTTLQADAKKLIMLPFNELRDLVNDTLGAYEFDSSALSIPAKKQLTFCDGNSGINDFFDGVTSIAITARKIFIAVLLIVAILVCIPVAWQEIRRWRSMKERSQLVRKEAHDPMDVVYIVSRPYTAAAGIKAASRFSNSRRQILVRWAIAYATSFPALFVLALAVAALFACFCQWLLLRQIKQTVPELSAEVGEFADKVVGALQNASAEWATDANNAIGKVDSGLNDDVFGWVNKTAGYINGTLNFFITNTSDTLNHTFSGTVLQGPVNDLYNCLVKLKAESMQKGLDWVVDHAHISLPTFPNDTFSAGASDSINSTSNPSDSFLADAGDETSNKITEVVIRVVNKLESAVRIEAIIATCILLVWVLIALIGVTRAMILFWGREKPRGEGGQGHILDPVPHGPHGHSPQQVRSSNVFDEVPLTAMPRGTNADEHVVPEYTAAPTSSVPVAGGHGYRDEKLGFAGQRNYGNALQVDGGNDLRGSFHVEYDVKR